MDLQQWLAHIERQHPSAIAMGLDRVREVAARLGLDRPARQVITVAGTNGKGSTVAFIEAIGRAAGWKVGAYTSPHLLRYNERVRVDGGEAPDAELVEAFEAVEVARGGTPLTYFEYGTLAALWLFQRARLDLAVLEVGLGGSLDAVNVVDPDVAVVTTVDIDHDLDARTLEALQAPRQRRVSHAGSECLVGRRVRQCTQGGDRRGGIGPLHRRGQPRLRQQQFAADLAPAPVRGVDGFMEKIAALADRIGADRVGMAQHAGRRIDLAEHQRLPRPSDAGLLAADRFAIGAQPVGVVDVAHNAQAVREVAAWLAAQPAAGATSAVFAALADKDAAAMVATLAGAVTRWHLAGLEGTARGQGVEAFAQRLAGTPAGAGSRDPDVAAALDRAIGLAIPGDRVLVFGSFHTAAAAIAMMRSGR
jgi:dihydrofolate synthase/folylpolyglutamate synthase